MNIIKYLQEHPSHRYRVGEVYKFLMDHFDIHMNVEVEWHTIFAREIECVTLKPLELNLIPALPMLTDFSQPAAVRSQDLIHHRAFCQGFGYQVFDNFNAWTFFRCDYYWKRETLSFFRHEDGRDYYQKYKVD